METKVKVIGHYKILKAWPSECGGVEGIAFEFEGEAPWVVPYTELERLLKSKPA